MTLALDLPLRGTRLIEASAGTGKTFTIALLYVRLILGQGRGADAVLPPLDPPDILVTTFTEAASLELRERIRQRLVEAALAFREPVETESAADDALLLALRDRYPEADWPACARRLELAADWMDDATISTIHGWAQRMLREHAFDSGQLFHRELVKDLRDLQLEAVTDYWRTRVYPLDESHAAEMVNAFGGPAKLAKQLKKLLDRPDALPVFKGTPLTEGSLTDALQAITDRKADMEKAEAQARATWQRDPAGIEQALQALRPGMNASVFRNKADDAEFERYLQTLRAWGQGDLPLTEATFVQKLARDRLKLNKGYECPPLALFDDLQVWHDHRAHWEAAREALPPRGLADARQWVAERMASTLEANAQMGFDNMISDLADALEGPSGDALAARIREQFPVAMIDEFQDIDPAQYRIFKRIYDLSADDADQALILIGDPKQAIYGFRGGDIHTYLAARAATAGRHHSLDRNFRSSVEAVEAVTQLFAHAEARHPQRAFRLGDALPFETVSAAGRRERLQLGEEPAAGIIGWILEPEDDKGVINFETYRDAAAAHCANRIAHWLNAAEAGEAGFEQPDDNPLEPLKASDIAILVRDRAEADSIRQALSDRGLSSVYLSDRESVFATPEARDLMAWLQAMANPESVSRVRSALASASLAQSLNTLDNLQQDELAWEAAQARFVDYRQRWQRHGVLPALRALMHDHEVPAALLARPNGERRLTNLLHLAEWAQQASDSLDGEHALVRVLSEHIDDPAGDEQILRLESDANLIQVVTVFKSKGLEYPVVALPFVCSYKSTDLSKGGGLFHAGDQPRLELAPKNKLAEESVETADSERLSEELRLLYVALTRARYATFLGIAPIVKGTKKTSTLHQSALGYLLGGGEAIPDAPTLRRLWQAHADQCPAITVAPGESEWTTHQPTEPPRSLRTALTPKPPAYLPWWIASYSALKQLGTGAPDTVAAEIRGEEHEALEAASSPLIDQRPAAGTLHDFPRGPEPGTFLHGVLEAAASIGFNQALADPGFQRRMVQRCERRGWGEHSDALQAGLQAWLTTPLGPDNSGLVLGQLTRYRAEPDFWFTTHQTPTPAIDRLVRTAIHPDAPRPTLGYQTLNGLMKGFIDLLVEHAGRYWIIDWKSNWLGPDDAAYSTDALQQAMLEKRHDLQLAVYLLALHRHLRQTLPDYDYERHVGGAQLVFLRGIQAPSRGVAAIQPSKAFIEALDNAFAGAAEATS